MPAAEEPSDSPPPPPPPPACPVKIVIFTVNLLIGLVISQAVPGWFDPDAYQTWQQVVKLSTMFCLSYIMTNVGYEFDVDKSKWREYGSDYGIAMTAAGFPWIFVAFWFVYALPYPLPWKEALVAARFAAPTSAGILFSMLEAAGMKETWLFQKARILAIFDDLDTILLMVPLKVIIVGFKWELSIDLLFVVVLLGVSWRYLHIVKIPVSSIATLGYAAVVTAVCELIHVITAYHIDAMDTVHLEVLLPAFAIGCIARSGHAENRHDDSLEVVPAPKGAEQTPASIAVIDMETENDKGSADTDPSLKKSCTGGTGETDIIKKDMLEEPPVELLQQRAMKRPAMKRRASLIIEDVAVSGTKNINTIISAVFMVFVGLSMPALFSDGRRLASGGSSGAGGGGSGQEMPAGALVLHVVIVTVLMVIGKMFPTLCYSKEANLRTRFALSLGMCPRGEVGAGVIVISLGFGITGSAVTVAVISLAVNLVLSSGFIMAVKHLAKEDGSTPVEPFAADAPFAADEQGLKNPQEGPMQVQDLEQDGLRAAANQSSPPNTLDV